MENIDGRGTAEEKRLSLLFVHHIKNRGFIKTDYDILCKQYDVTDFHYRGGKDILGLLLECRRHDIVYSWFMSLHSFFTTFNKAKKVYVAGGYDASAVPGYGLGCKWYTRLLVKRCLSCADIVLSVSKFNDEELKKNFGFTDAVMIYNSVDTEYFKPDGVKDVSLFLTVACMDSLSFVRKGVADFVALARTAMGLKLPYVFVVVGSYSDDLKIHINSLQDRIPNLCFTGFISDEQLLKYYQEAKVYCQLSSYESFGLSLAEAMSCGCIPLISGNAALPEVTGGLGSSVCIAVEDVLKEVSSSDEGGLCRDRVVCMFSKKRREEKLLNVMKGL